MRRVGRGRALERRRFLGRVLGTDDQLDGLLGHRLEVRVVERDAGFDDAESRDGLLVHHLGAHGAEHPALDGRLLRARREPGARRELGLQIVQPGAYPGRAVLAGALPADEGHDGQPGPGDLVAGPGAVLLLGGGEEVERLGQGLAHLFHRGRRPVVPSHFESIGMLRVASPVGVHVDQELPRGLLQSDERFGLAAAEAVHFRQHFSRGVAELQGQVDLVRHRGELEDESVQPRRRDRQDVPVVVLVLVGEALDHAVEKRDAGLGGRVVRLLSRRTPGPKAGDQTEAPSVNIKNAKGSLPAGLFSRSLLPRLLFKPSPGPCLCFCLLLF